MKKFIKRSIQAVSNSFFLGNKRPHKSDQAGDPKKEVINEQRGANYREKGGLPQ